MVPSPPEVIQRLGLSNLRNWAAHIWCWPTSVVKKTSLSAVSAWSRSSAYCGLIILSEC